MDEDNGQGALAPADDFAGLVALLRDNPEADAATDQPTDDGTRLPATTDDDPDNLLDGTTPDSENQPGPDDATDRQAGEKIKVQVKGADGADTTIEVSRKELVDGYLRREDYTRKTQELSTQRAQVMSIADQRINEGHARALESIQKTEAMIVRLAQLPTPHEMAALAARDPQSAMVEQTRVAAVQAELQALEGQAAKHRGDMAELEKQALIRAFADCWNVLNSEGITKPQLEVLFKKVQDGYGIPEERFQKISDPKLILMMRDAVQLRELKAQAGTNAKAKLAAAPRLPAQRQTVPASAKVNRSLDGKFKSKGGGSINDLAAWIGNNSR